MEQYQPTTNYERLWLQYLENQGDRKIEQIATYHSLMATTEQATKLWGEPDEVWDRNKYCYGELWHVRDKVHKDSETQQNLKEKVFKNNSLENPYYFITINYPADLLGLHRIKEITTNINKLEWIKTIEYVYEYHTKGGGHPHCHMLITTEEKMPKSRIIDKIFAVKNIKKLIPGKQSIDVADNYNKTIQVYRDYIDGHKRESKTENCQKDAEWRIQNNLND